MKIKNFFLTYFFIVSEILISQTKYKVETNITQTTVNTGNIFSIDLNIGQTYLFNVDYITTIQSGQQTVSQTSNKVVNFNENGIPTHINLRHGVLNLGGAGGLNWVDNIFSFNNNCYTINNYLKPAYGLDADYIRIYKLDNILTLNNFSSTNNEIKECEPYNLKIYNNNCSTDMSYALEYSIGNNNWIELFPYGPNSDSVDINFSDIPNLKVNDNLNFKVRYTNLNNGSDDYSDIITFAIGSCSPQLVENGFSSTNTSCSYTQDGSFNMTFDRDLDTNEKLVVTLYKKSSTGEHDEIPFQGQQESDTLINNGNNTYTYNWPIPVYSGSYKVKYQTINQGEAVDENSWDSLEFSPEFIVENPPPLIFSLSLENNVNCFNGSDGRIRVSSYGGSGGYKYFLEGNVVPFTNTGVGTQTAPINQIITGLSSGQKNIKVQDANNCEEQN